jgi:hypothetical protein
MVGSSVKGSAKPPAEPVEVTSALGLDRADPPHGLDLSGVMAKVAVRWVLDDLPERAQVGGVANRAQILCVDSKRILVADDVIEVVGGLGTEDALVALDGPKALFTSTVGSRPAEVIGPLIIDPLDVLGVAGEL